MVLQQWNCTRNDENNDHTTQLKSRCQSKSFSQVQSNHSHIDKSVVLEGKLHNCEEGCIVLYCIVLY